MENDENKTTFLSSKLKKVQFTNLPGTKCCILGCPAITDSLVCFPAKHTEEYTFWLRACKESEANIIFKQNPMICVLHFRKCDKMPVRFVTAKDLEILNDDLARVNHCVAEWLLLARKNVPGIIITDDDIRTKAKEIVRVYQLKYFEHHADFGWIRIFENYLRSRGIETWNPQLRRSHMDINENIHLVRDAEKDTTTENETEESIKSYDEALRRVNVLYRYCKRTENKSALDLVERLCRVLQNRV